MNDNKLTESVKIAYNALDSKFGKDISVLKIGDISILADYFILATGDSSTHLKAMAEEVERKLSEHGVRLNHSEDHKGSKWVLLDFGSIIVHLFSAEEREFYNLDAVWRDAEIIVP